MFQSKVRKVLIQAVHDDVHEINPFLQLRDMILPLSLHGVQQKHSSRMSRLNTRPRKPGIFVSGLLPKRGGSVMGSQEIHHHLIVVSDIGGSVVQMLIHVVRSIRLERRGKIKGGGGSIEHGIGSSESRHSSRGRLEGRVVVVIGGSGKETMKGTIINPPDLNTS
jgi:hypothetical protein